MSLALLLRFRSEIIIGVLLIAIGVLWHSLTVSLTDRGIALERARVADSALKVITPKLARVDTLVVHDVPRVIHAAARVDTLRDSVVAHLTDTLIVKEYVARTDTALKVCRELADDCAQFRVFANQKIAALESKLNVAPIIDNHHRVISNLLWGAVGAAVGYEAHRLHPH